MNEQGPENDPTKKVVRKSVDEKRNKVSKEKLWNLTMFKYIYERFSLLCLVSLHQRVHIFRLLFRQPWKSEHIKCQRQQNLWNALYAFRNTERKSPILIHSARNLGRFVCVVVGDEGGSGGVYKL